MSVHLLRPRVSDLVFQLYGQMLGIDPAIIPGMVARACVFDSFMVLGLVTFRRRRQIAEWMRQRREGPVSPDRFGRVTEAGPTLPAE